jgi:endoglucanase Acf2
MPRILIHRLALFLSVICLLAADLPAQDLPADDLPEVVPVGAGSYGTRPPRTQAARPGVSGKAGWGDLSQVFTHMKLYVRDDHKGAVPSTDWWTSLVTKQWSGQLWAYPAMFKAEPAGLGIFFPKEWVVADNKKKAHMESASKLLVRGKGFTPSAALADAWSDWVVSILMPQSDTVWMKATIGHGLPTTWIETSGIDLRIDTEKPAWFSVNGSNTNLPFTGNAIGVESNGDCYGIFAPEGTTFSADGSSLAIKFSGAQKWISIALLPARKDMATFQKVAAVVPRKGMVAWDYSPEKGTVATTWTLDTENLAGGAERDVIQGWIPHHYDTAKGTQLDFSFNGLTYATPRGKLQCATGHSFGITYPFRGLLPELPAPQLVAGLEHPYRPEVMKSIIDGYTSVNGYGFETYWGGKKILLFAKYMEMAHQLGLNEQAALFQTKLHEALTDWATYTPGEEDHFFAMYPNWGSLMGFRTRDNQNPGIDVLQDHAFCYAYHVYAAALLAVHDPDFAEDYGGMATLMVKDYANWDASDTRFPRFRSMDPWIGHSWSGGTGSEEGNGQESSSEAVQAWGAMFVLGEVLGNKEMRDAGAFGWISETRAIAEYWFDRDKENLPYDKWPNAYNSNEETNGIGWWTWFSGNNYWMHAIQWLPMSPFLKYLGEDQAFARWDYETMWKTKEGNGWEGNLGTDSGVGNITLSYLQLFDPTEAARIFDDLWDKNKGAVHAKEEPGPTYYRIHAGRALGTIDWASWTDIPTSTVYKDAAGKPVVAVYNMSGEEKTGTLYLNGKASGTFKVPPRSVIAHKLDSKPAALTIESPFVTTEPNKPLKLTGRLLDQYGATTAGDVKWTVASGATVAADGTFQSAAAGTYAVTATSGTLSAKKDIRVGAAPVLSKITLAPPPQDVKPGDDIALHATTLDQYGDPYPAEITWKGDNDLRISKRGRLVVPFNSPLYTVTASSGSQSASVKIPVLIPGSGEGAPVLTRIIVEPHVALMSDRQTQQFTAKGYDQFGKPFPITPEWKIDGKGSIDAGGLYTPNGGADHATSRFGVIASANGIQDTAWAAVEESRRVAKVTLTPSPGREINIAAGGTIRFSADVTDQFNARFELPVKWSATGNVQITPDGAMTAGAAGTGSLTVEAGGQTQNIAVKVLRPEEVNIAAFKPVTASSVEKNGTEPEGAADNDPKSRWASASSDPQWIMIDLESEYSLKKIVVNWQNAAAKEYVVELSPDGNIWNKVASVTDGKPGLRTFDLAGQRGRYLRLTGTKRTTGYGYSLFEVEAYGTPSR